MATKTKAKPAAKAKAAKATPTKDNRYLRAFRLIADNPRLDAEAIARRASMSTSMAGNCIVAWAAAVQVLDDRKALRVKPSELLPQREAASQEPRKAGEAGLRKATANAAPAPQETPEVEKAAA